MKTYRITSKQRWRAEPLTGILLYSGCIKIRASVSSGIGHLCVDRACVAPLQHPFDVGLMLCLCLYGMCVPYTSAHRHTSHRWPAFLRPWLSYVASSTAQRSSLGMSWHSAQSATLRCDLFS